MEEQRRPAFMIKSETPWRMSEQSLIKSESKSGYCHCMTVFAFVRFQMHQLTASQKYFSQAPKYYQVRDS